MEVDWKSWIPYRDDHDTGPIDTDPRISGIKNEGKMIMNTE